VLWYDQAYPYGEYTGYQQYLYELIRSIPIKIENTYSSALKELNKSSSSTKYILVITGKKKKKLMEEVHNNANIEKVYIIKPFAEKVMKWSKKYKKLTVLREFKELVEKLKKIADTYVPGKFDYGIKERLINYAVSPDLMTMSQQSVTALLDEISQSEAQAYYKNRYAVILRKFREHVEKYEKEKEEVSCNNDFVDSSNFLLFWIYLLEVSEYFNECPYIFHGASAKELIENTSDKKQVFDSLRFLSQDIKADGKIDIKVHNELLKKLHISLYRAIMDYYSANSILSNKQLYLTRMLLEDIDVCLKVFIFVLFKLQRGCGNLAEEFLHAVIVGDNRVSVLFELWEAWEDKRYYSELNLQGSELEKVLDQITIRNVVLLNLSKTLTPLVPLIEKSFTLFKYYILRDFRTDLDTLAKLRYSFTYIIIEPSLTVSEYNQLIDTCIQNAIIPMFVLYLDSNNKKIAKEMLKPRWIVSFVYCRNLSDIKEYLTQNENNINRDFAQYAKYYDNFKATLSKSRKTHPPPKLLQDDSKAEADGGWEMLSTIDKSVFNQLVEESALGTKLTGSLHYYFLKSLKALNFENIYWQHYPQLFGVTNKYATVLDINCAKCLLHAYTLQTVPAFYKMMNDAFRIGTEESVAKYRSFFSILHDCVKKGILKKHIGFVYRGTYFNKETLDNLIEGKTIYSTCFTSTSKSETVAREFARKAKRNVLLEIELDPRAGTNVDIHEEGCSRYPEEQEVLLLPFSNFLIKRKFKEENIIVISLKEQVPEYEVISIKGIEYGN